MIEYITNHKDGTVTRSSNNPDAKSMWIRCESPSEEEIAMLLSIGVDADIISDALDPHEVPRVEREDSIIYFITRVPDVGDAFNSFTTPILFAIDANHLITLSHDSLGRLWQPFIEKNKIDTRYNHQLFLFMMEMLVHQYEQRVTVINRQMRALTGDVVGLSSKDIARFTEYERKLNDYLDAIIPTNTAINQIVGNRLLRLKEEYRDQVEDLSIDLEQLIARCKSLLRTMHNVRDSYRAVMDTRLNETMRALTIITVAIAVPTMLAGFYGMNVELPGQGVHAMFWVIALLSILASSAVIWYFVWHNKSK